ncbi:ABC transporter permease [Algoriphagus halophytocola]|uniref:ABC transporter permease n=1 Tax=Algoriphagus halophytocola TaxID=2991499 RepID=A0ABY6MJK8_9BACT|nr:MULTISPECIES: ABC transporter permease [unclassified Algoriphagus]UZD23972.1 ABC transporter permease [Algoriphagus sp. TR-M5]WBL41344.1 ABC transporter permease [Algoriphagus sp. TR-M9]
MFKNYFKIVFRNAKKNPLYVFINLLGLSIGMAVSILIFLYVQHELSYDTYHTQADRIYRVSRSWNNGDGETSLHLGHLAPPFGPLIKSDFEDQVDEVVRLFNSGLLIKSGENSFVEDEFFFADPELFDVFSWKMIEGDPVAALNQADGVLVSESIARKYFGSESAIGKELLGEVQGLQLTFQVRGVFEDIPDNTHMHPDFIASMAPVIQFYGGLEPFMSNFGSNNFSTYLLLKEGYDYQALEAQLPALIDRNMGEAQAGVPQSQTTALHLWPITDIHLHSNLDSEIEANSNIEYVYTYLAVALFILLIACINFMNLSTARSSLRSMEVGIRKVMGADRRRLIKQFMGESFVMAFISMILAVLIVFLFLPTFAAFTQKQLHLDFISNPEYLLSLLGLVVCVGLLAGSYPALFLSGFTPSRVLKGTFKAGKGHENFRSVLVVGQFAISVMLIVAVIVVVRQLDFMQSKALGFDKEDVVVLPASTEITENYQLIKDRLMNHPGISAVTISSRVPSARLLDSQGGSAEVNGEMSQLTVRIADIHVGHDFIQTYGIPMVAGRDFDYHLASDSTGAFVLNESAVRAIGWTSPEAAVGQKFNYGGRSGFVTGVMKDFHFESLHQPIVPMVFMITQDRSYAVSMKIDKAQKAETLAYLQGEWADLNPGYPFEPIFVDEGFNRQYEAEQRVKTIFTFFSALAILISVLGLLGLTTFATEQRTREIGIRKVMGAETGNILVLLAKDFMKLVMLGFLIAIPVSWFGMNTWLDDFAYKIGISWTVFLWAGTIAGAIAAITVMSQSLKAAWADPVKSIKSE